MAGTFSDQAASRPSMPAFALCVWTTSGSLTFQCSELRPSGEGRLLAAIERRLANLERATPPLWWRCTTEKSRFRVMAKTAEVPLRSCCHSRQMSHSRITAATRLQTEIARRCLEES